MVYHTAPYYLYHNTSIKNKQATADKSHLQSLQVLLFLVTYYKGYTSSSPRGSADMCFAFLCFVCAPGVWNFSPSISAMTILHACTPSSPPLHPLTEF